MLTLRSPGMPTAVRVVLLVRKVYASSHPGERSFRGLIPGLGSSEDMG